MRCRIDGVEVAAAKLAVRTFNFGDPLPHLHNARWELEVPFSVAAPLLETAFTQFAVDLRHDETFDPHHESWPELQTYQELGYPAFSVMLQFQPRLLEMLICRWHAADVLDKLLHRSPEPSHLINSLDSVQWSGESAQFRGTAVVKSS